MKIYEPISIIDHMPRQPEAVDYEDAAEILDRDGWCQGHFSEYNADTGGKSYCMGGAISQAIKERLHLDSSPYLDWVAVHVDTEIALGDFDMGASVPRWNDDPRRTKEEVQDRLMLAAKKLRNEGR